MKIRVVADHEETMRTSGRHPQSLMRIRSQVITIPSTIGGGAFAQIDDDIEDGPRSDPNKLPLGSFAGLVV